MSPPRRRRDPRRARLTAAHRDHQRALADTVAARLAAQLRALPDVTDQSRDLYIAGAVAVIVAGQRRAATLAAGYVRAIAPTRSHRQAPALELGDLAVTAATAWVASPIIRARAKLAQGLVYTQAIDAAASYAGALASGDLQMAERFGMSAAADATGENVRGWVKEADGNACAWCQDVAGGVYHDADSVPMHENDLCSVAPLFA